MGNHVDPRKHTALSDQLLARDGDRPAVNDVVRHLLAALLAAYDDAALEGASSKGVMIRARKDAAAGRLIVCYDA